MAEIDESITGNRGKVVGFTKQQTAVNTTCINKTTYEINWKYRTNLSGNNAFIFTGKQIEGFNQKKLKKPLQAGDVVRFKRQGHGNNNMKAIIKKITKPLSDEEMAVAGKDIRQTVKFPPVYDLEFLISPFFKGDQVKKLKTSKKEELDKIINHKSQICINWRQEAILAEIKKNETEKGKRMTQLERTAIRLKHNKESNPGTLLNKDKILEGKITQKMKMIFLRNKKFKPDAISAWESNSKQKFDKNEMVSPDGIYYIKSVTFNGFTEKLITNKDTCDINPPYYKAWVTVFITLRKEALDIGSDILFNGKLFLGCAEKKKNVLEILNDIQKEAINTVTKLKNQGTETKKVEPEPSCKYEDKKVEEEDMAVDIEVSQGFIRDQKVMVASETHKWEGMLLGEIKRVNDTKGIPVTYKVRLIDSNMILDKVKTEYLRPVVDGGVRRRSRRTTKRVRRNGMNGRSRRSGRTTKRVRRSRGNGRSRR